MLNGPSVVYFSADRPYSKIRTCSFFLPTSEQMLSIGGYSFILHELLQLPRDPHRGIFIKPQHFKVVQPRQFFG